MSIIFKFYYVFFFIALDFQVILIYYNVSGLGLLYIFSFFILAHVLVLHKQHDIKIGGKDYV